MYLCCNCNALTTPNIHGRCERCNSEAISEVAAQFVQSSRDSALQEQSSSRDQEAHSVCQQTR